MLVKFSLKKEKILGSFTENFEGVEQNKYFSNKGESLDNVMDG